MGQRHQFCEFRLLAESGDLKIGAVHAQQEPCLFVDGVFVVGQPRAIGGADFAQNRARFRHHIGNAERAPDFDQLAARDDDFSAFGQSIERQQDSGGIIVDDDRGDWRMSRAPRREAYPTAGETGGRHGHRACHVPRLDVEFEVRISGERRGYVPARKARAGRVPDWCAG